MQPAARSADLSPRTGGGCSAGVVQRSGFGILVRSVIEIDALRIELSVLHDEDVDLRFNPLCRRCREPERDADGREAACFPGAHVR